MSVSIHGTGTIIGIDQGIQISGVSTFSNNVSIGGVLTYEDVTNIDSIGIITARSGIDGDLTGNVTGNVTGDITGNIAGTSTIAGISSSISDSATDVFVYDTSKDSDGGAWRKRTQYTSWYNETLNTSTRGSRREFPAVAVIVAEQNFIRIYDGDDPDLPMWMVFNVGSQGMANTPMVQLQNVDKVVYALNGILVTGTKNENSNYGQPVINFISEKVLRMDSQGGEGGEWMGTIAQRNETIGYRSVDYDYVIAVSQVNDVAMTVLPNAPIDEATGLPVPTIAVATNGGLSVITDSGSVFDDTTSAGVSSAGVEGCAFSGTKVVYYRGGASGNKVYVQDVYGISADFTGQRMYRVAPYGETNEVTDVCHGLADIDAVEGSDDNLILGAEEGIAIINEDLESSTRGLVAKIASDYNTGWMPGKVQGAFLSDTDDTNLSTTDLSLITNGDFSNGTTGWSNDATPTFTVSGGGVASVDRNGGGATGQCYQTITTEVGRTYTVGVLVSAVSNGFQVYAGEAPSASNITMSHGAINSTGTHYWTFTATTTSTRLDFSATQNVNGTASFDNITIFDGDADRSANRKGLTTYGTITKSAVATGAELVAYSGFQHTNPDNYLKQPYNSDLDFGTGDFNVTWWQYITGDIANSEYVYDRQGGNGNRHAVYYTSGNSGSLAFYTNAGSSSETIATGINSYKDGWACYTVNRNSSGLMQIYINGELKQSSTGLPTRDLTNTSAELFIGIRHSVDSGAATQAKFALMRFSKSIPSAAQVKKMYEDEKVLFQENAACTLYGSSNAVTALAHDEVTDRLHVGTSSGRSDFQGLRRINNTTTAVTTAISTHDGFIVEQ